MSNFIAQIVKIITLQMPYICFALPSINIPYICLPYIELFPYMSNFVARIVKIITLQVMQKMK